MTSSWFSGPFPAPPMPDSTPFAEASVRLRWEDVAQDGRIMLTALAPALDWTIWNGLLKDHAGVSQVVLELPRNGGGMRRVQTSFRAKPSRELAEAVAHEVGGDVVEVVLPR